MSTETILQTIGVWKEQPENAQVRPAAAARADQRGAVIEAGSFTWRTDLPAALGGSNLAPSPTLLLLGALAGCAVVFIRDTLGPLLNVPITDVRATVRCRTDLRGLLGLDGAAPDLEDIELGIEIISPDERGVQTVFQAWLERCPVFLALARSVKVAATIEVKAR